MRMTQARGGSCSAVTEEFVANNDGNPIKNDTSSALAAPVGSNIPQEFLSFVWDSLKILALAQANAQGQNDNAQKMAETDVDMGAVAQNKVAEVKKDMAEMRHIVSVALVGVQDNHDVIINSKVIEKPRFKFLKCKNLQRNQQRK